ncbi:MAG: LysM peptidoglycan-binding domain-containing protein [Frankiales bacterium]|nr:LysM peptidoglycan-binding domain-containing protein [Frankiales bacterium]
MLTHPTRGRAAAAPLHLTRRGRATLLVLLVAVLLAVFSLGRANSQAADAAGNGPVPATGQITVQQGESLWTVARRLAPLNDPRDVIAQIVRLNDLSDSQLQIGQQLRLPVAG